MAFSMIFLLSRTALRFEAVGKLMSITKFRGDLYIQKDSYPVVGITVFDTYGDLENGDNLLYKNNFVIIILYYHSLIFCQFLLARKKKEAPEGASFLFVPL